VLQCINEDLGRVIAKSRGEGSAHQSKTGENAYKAAREKEGISESIHLREDVGMERCRKGGGAKQALQIAGGQSTGEIASSDTCSSLCSSRASTVW
jgi:hypothetical protein